MKNNNKGLGLVETIITISVFALIGLSVLSTYLYYKSNLDLDKNINLYTNLKNIINSNAMFSASYQGVDVSDLIKEGGLPSYSIVNNQNIINTSGEKLQIKVKNGDWSYSKNDLITIKSNGYNRKECVKLVSRIAPDFFIVSVNGGIVQLDANNNVDMSDLSTKCDKKDNMIAFNMVKTIDLGNLKQSQYVDGKNDVDENTIMDFEITQQQSVVVSNLYNSGCSDLSYQGAGLCPVRNSISSQSRLELISSSVRTEKKTTLKNLRSILCKVSSGITDNTPLHNLGNFTCSYDQRVNLEGVPVIVLVRVNIEPVEGSQEKYEQPSNNKDEWLSKGLNIEKDFYQQQKIRMSEVIKIRQACVMKENSDNNNVSCNASLFK